MSGDGPTASAAATAAGMTGPAATISLRSLPYLDEKWLRADLYAALQSTEDLAHLWNNLVRDQELCTGTGPTASSSSAGTLNAAGNVSYLSAAGRYYCGAQRLQCSCCTGFCRPSSACNCVACELLDAEPPESSGIGARRHQHHARQQHQQSADASADCAAGASGAQASPSDAILNSWLWGPVPSTEEQVACIKALLAEQRDISLKAASHSLSAVHLRQRLFVYQRYFTALTRVRTGVGAGEAKSCKVPAATAAHPNGTDGGGIAPTLRPSTSNDNVLSDPNTPVTVGVDQGHERATLGLARVGTRAALNFSFAFLRRAWRSGEDTDLCSELLADALEALQGLPEASLFDTSQVSALWSEVLERSSKFLRQVVLGDVMGGRCVVPRADRHIALSLLMELGSQKGTLSATLEVIVLLLTVWEKDRHEVEDNRAPAPAQPAAGGSAPLASILRRYAEISAQAAARGDVGAINGGNGGASKQRNGERWQHEAAMTPTETFLSDVRLPTLTDEDGDATAVDLKQAAVMMACHLDRMVQAQLPSSASAVGTAAAAAAAAASAMPKKRRASSSAVLSNNGVAVAAAKQQVFMLGCVSGLAERHGFTAAIDPALDWPLLGDVEQQYCGSMLVDLGGAPDACVQQVICAVDRTVYMLNTRGEVWCLDADQPQPHGGGGGGGQTQSTAAPPSFGGNGNEQRARHLADFGGSAVIQLAGHCEGKHMLALTADRQVFSWGIGDGGRLGHGDTVARAHPTRVQYFEEHTIVGVFCGAAYSAAISASGVLYTWGRGFYGSLGHGTSEDKLLPTVVQTLCGHPVVDVALGSGDSHSLCVTADGTVYAWGDNDFGKLGTGTCMGTHVPVALAGLSGVRRVWSGSQFSVALTNDGEVYTWGKSHGGRLGHDGGRDGAAAAAAAAADLATSTSTCASSGGGAAAKMTPEYCSVPRRVDTLVSKNVLQVAVGSAHCLALTAQGEVYGWGRNDFHQIGPPTVCRDTVVRVPVQTTPASMRMVGVACGAAQSVLWREAARFGLPRRVPFVVDLSEQAFRSIDQLLGMVVVGPAAAVVNLAAPSVETECIAVACLNVLRLQLHALLTNQVPAHEIGLADGSRLLASLKSRLLALAGGANIHRSIQDAAQWALQVGWSVFLPTAAERARTLTALLPSEPGVQSSSGHRFMTDLLVSSLMAEEGLQTALRQAIHAEPEPESAATAHNLPLLHLIKQLLRNNSALTQARLAQLGADAAWRKCDADDETSAPPAGMPSPSLDLLHRFQRLLLSHIHQQRAADDVAGAEALLGKYMHHVISQCVVTLSKAHEVAAAGGGQPSQHLCEAIVNVLSVDISNTLLFELLIGLILLHHDRPLCLGAFNWNKHLVPLLGILDHLNRSISEPDVQDSDDLGWPAIICRGSAHQRGSTAATKETAAAEETTLYRQSDVDNHVADGGKWIIVNGFVCDVQDYRCENAAIAELIDQHIGADLTGDLQANQQRCVVDQLIAHHSVGRFAYNDSDEKPSHPPGAQLTHLHSERALGYLLGLRAMLLQRGQPLQPDELQCRGWLRSPMLSGGLQVLQPSNPFDEEKGEARSSASTAGSTPTETSMHAMVQPMVMAEPQPALWPHMLITHRVDSLLTGLGDARLTDPVVAAWLAIVERYCKQNNLIWHQDFPPDHPISELERHLTAVFIHHQSIGALVLAVVDRELSGSVSRLPAPVANIIKLVHSTKWTLIRTRQQLNRSYKEVCTPMLEKCRFLLYEVRPAFSSEQSGLQRLNILHREPRFRTLVRRIIAEIRHARKMSRDAAKPDDILNGTIQSQSLQQKNTLSNEALQTRSLTASTNEQQQSTGTPPNQHRSTENLLAVQGGGDSDSNVLTKKSTAAAAVDGVDAKPIGTPAVSAVMQQPQNHRGKSVDSDEQFINNVIARMSEKCVRVSENGPPVATVMSLIVDYVLQDAGDVETLRRAMYCQVQRYHTRKQGLSMFSELLSVGGLLDAVQYSVLSGYMGVFVERPRLVFGGNVLDDLNVVTAFQKADLILAHSRVIEWTIGELQRFVNQEQQQQQHGGSSGGASKAKYHGSKDKENLGTYGFVKKLPRARFLLSVFGILARDLGPNEISLVVDSGALGCILGLLRQTGGDTAAAAAAATSGSNELTYVFEDTISKKAVSTNVVGAELAKLMKIGTKIVRGADWKWGEQDGPPPGEGRIISEVGEDGWVRVEWDNGATNSYRMGKEGQYDLRLADTFTLVTPDTETDEDTSLCESTITAASHPTKLLRNACTKMLKIFSVSVGRHANKMNASAVRSVAAMFRAILTASKTGTCHLGLEHWTTLGFLRAIASARTFAACLTTRAWFDLHIGILQTPIVCEQDVYKKVQSLRLLQATLECWQPDDDDGGGGGGGGFAHIVERLFHVFGRIVLQCPNDLSLIQNPIDVRARVLLTCSHSGTVAEEIVALLRKLHTCSTWNAAINQYVTQKLYMATEMMGEAGFKVGDEADKAAVLAVLTLIGGCDPRPRVGLTFVHDHQSATVTNFTYKGKALLSVHNTSEVKKVPVALIREALEAAAASAGLFSMSRLTFNEMLLNSWSILLTGPGQWKTTTTMATTMAATITATATAAPAANANAAGRVDAQLLRAQQIHLATLNATSVLFRHQISLRKILRQRAATAAGLLSRFSSSEDSLSEHDNDLGEMMCAEVANAGTGKEDNSGGSSQSLANGNNLIETILTRATQTNPLKAHYSYAELAMAALNLTQHLASHVHTELTAPTDAALRQAPLPAQPTLIHGVPIYNDQKYDEGVTFAAGTGGGGGGAVAARPVPPASLLASVMEMGFPQTAVELAIRRLTLDATLTNIPPTVEQIVQWMLEHPGACVAKESAIAALARPTIAGADGGPTAAAPALGRTADFDADSDSDSGSTETIEGGSSVNEAPNRYALSTDFKTADQYAMYVRGLVVTGMLVKCCRDFEEIRRGDMGHVLRVDTEGLHDLNVQVDWQMHGTTYWMRFVHVELLEPPSPPPATTANATLTAADAGGADTSAEITIGSHVRIRPNVAIPCYKWGSVMHGSIGVVTAIDERDVTVDFPQQFSWTGQLSEMELVCQANPEAMAQMAGGGSVAGGGINGEPNGVGQLIEDWSRCIRTLSVSSNEQTARHLLDRSANYWQSASGGSSGASSGGGRHWIRIEMHENVLVHSLAIVVSPHDCSHQPALVVVRVGDTVDTLKDFGWVSVKPIDTHLQLLSDMRQHHRWLEVVIKQCRNNGIHCRVHAVHVTGRRRQTDVDLMLMNASFLSTEFDQLREPSSSTSSSSGVPGGLHGGGYAFDDQGFCTAGASTASLGFGDEHGFCTVGAGTPALGFGGEPTASAGCKVLVWGLNDKEQLGGLKGSKIKIPSLSTTLSQLRPVHLSGGSKSLFVVSQDGKVYACGEGTNGRLGLGHNYNVSTPRKVPILSQYVVKKVAVHSGGKHAMALTLDGKVFSWGEGEDGKLGHGNRITLDKPKLVEALRAKRVRDIACGSSHSAAITSSGELYTWGLGEYGRLGHGDNATQLKPRLVVALLEYRVVQVACGSRDAQTLALTEEGFVFSWGDGDFGKLGRGGSEGCSVPHQVERLNGIGIVQIECGAQFSLALSKAGEVWTWGKGDYYRLGHGSDQHVRKPTPIHGLRGKRVIHVAVGALHCLAVTETGQVFAWGDNDHGQQGSGTTVVNKKPVAVVGLDNMFVNRVACGSSHSVAWSLPQSAAEGDKKDPVPFAQPKDPLGSAGLGFYDAERPAGASPGATVGGKPLKPSLSEVLLSLESRAARQTALNFVLNAMSIIQARQCIVAALTSHSQLGSFEKISDSEHYFKELEELHSPQHGSGGGGGSGGGAGGGGGRQTDVIVQGGGEALADVSALIVQDQPSTPDSECPPVGVASAIHGAQFASLAGSMSLSTSVSSVNARQSKMSVSAMSVMAATMTHQDEVINDAEVIGLDEFTALLGESEAKSLVELLKLSVAGRTGAPPTTQTIASTLIALGIHSAPIGGMLLETCITELEDLCTSRHFLGKMPKPVVQETSHPYIDDITLVGHVRIPGAEALRLEFDSQCSTEKRNDPLIIMDGAGRVIATRSGREYAQWTPEIKIAGDEMRWKFTSDSSVNGWGWKFWVHAIMPPFFLQELGADRAVLSQPSMDLVMALLDSRLTPQSSSLLLRLAAALAACTQLNTLTTGQRIWAVKKLDAILKSKHSPGPLDPTVTTFLTPLIPALLKQYDYEESQVRTGVHLMHTEYFRTLAALACDMRLDTLLPQSELHKWAWFRRYCAAVRVAQSLVHRSALPRAFIAEVRKKISDMMPSKAVHISSATAASTATLLTMAEVVSGVNGSISTATTSSANVAAAPPFSASSVDHYIDSLASSAAGSTADDVIAPGPSVPAAAASPDGVVLCSHEDQHVFKTQHDRQLLQWLNRRPEDWALSWGGASTIYGWGHNHRGQLGGLEGGRIKAPTPCESLSLLRPIQLCGGEQTLYAVTADGKLFATGYGAGGRLGIGGMDSVSTPILVESLQHVFVKKVAVNSGGKHCLALTADGEVYSWGEGEDGKLGHGNRQNCDRPKLVEALSGIGVVDVACGSAHSACITAAGNVMTWGKGRYGRLGHGDSEDHLRPKLVEAVMGYRAVDIACGSGDAQTICITDDDNVWSWGDGDYGKLGRGGSDGCKYPAKIESLAGLGVVKVECGSQFSVALTRSGAVYTWGKGDYHRLGHGSVEHVRRPRKVAALQGKKIVSIATGSLHCVACSDGGEVYTWGDNDEGQLGDGTVSAVQRPRVVQALQGKHIVKVTCGSAHTLALSTTQMSEGARPPPNPPLEYDFVRDLPLDALHSRLVLLHHFSELLCPCLAMLPMAGCDLSLGALKDVLVYSIKEAAFRKVIQTTMVRDKQHGPVIELNRIQVKRARTRANGGLAGVDGMKSVFGQMVQKLPLLNQEALYLPHRVWKVKFVGESVDDCGGGFSESIAEMCDELQNGSVPLLIQTPNGRGEAGTNRDCFLLDPTLQSVLQMNMFRFLGVLMGIAVRTGSPLSLNLAEPVWRQLTGETLRPSDLTEVDRDYVASLICIRDMEDDPRVFQTLELPFSTPSAKGHEVPLSTRYTRITPQNKHEYVRLALNYRLHEFDEQVKAVRDGMSKVIPVPLLSLFSASQLQAMVCGSPEIPLALLKSVATYKGVDATAPLIGWFWDVMEEFSNQERSLFLRFVWGRTRLPRTIADFRGRDFVLQVLDKYNPADHFLPESYTCFFLLKMPRYSCKAILLEKLKYAIYFCKSIDTDEYARVAMVEPTEATVSDNNSDVDSEISEEM